jgi:hypothetical protein
LHLWAAHDELIASHWQRLEIAQANNGSRICSGERFSKQNYARVLEVGEVWQAVI